MDVVKAAWSLNRNAKTLFRLNSSSNDNNKQYDRDSPLDGLRALAALWVVSFHLFVVLPYLLQLNPDDRAIFNDYAGMVIIRPVDLGDYGVDIFFILSGCLIMAILGREMKAAMRSPTVADSSEPLLQLDEQQQQPGNPTMTRTIINFFIRRYARLMPAYTVALVCLMVEASIKGDNDGCLYDVWRNFLFINNLFSSGGCMPWSWSIAIEWQMYLVSPFIVWTVLRWPRWRFGVLFGLTAISMGLYIGLTVRTFYTDKLFQSTVYNMPYSRMFAYFLGMSISLSVSDKKAEARAHPEVDVAPLTISRVVLRFLSISSALLVAFSDNTVGSDAWSETKMVLVRPIFVVAMAYIVYDALLPRMPGSDHYQGFANSVLGSRLLYILAQLSYSVYLFHLFFAESIYGLLSEPICSGTVSFKPAWIYPVMAMSILFLTICLAIAVYFIIEKPFNNLAADLTKHQKHVTGEK